MLIILVVGVYPSFTQQDWIKKVYPNLRPDDMPTHECIQEAGEILYIVCKYQKEYSTRLF